MHPPLRLAVGLPSVKPSGAEQLKSAGPLHDWTMPCWGAQSREAVGASAVETAPGLSTRRSLAGVGVEHIKSLMCPNGPCPQGALLLPSSHTLFPTSVPWLPAKHYQPLSLGRLENTKEYPNIWLRKGCAKDQFLRVKSIRSLPTWVLPFLQREHESLQLMNWKRNLGRRPFSSCSKKTGGCGPGHFLPWDPGWAGAQPGTSDRQVGWLLPWIRGAPDSDLVPPLSSPHSWVPLSCWFSKCPLELELATSLQEMQILGPYAWLTESEKWGCGPAICLTSLPACSPAHKSEHLHS